MLLFAALPTLGNFAGGALGEFVPVSRLMLNLALYAAAGVVVAVVAVELMPRAASTSQNLAAVALFTPLSKFHLALTLWDYSTCRWA